MFAVDYETYYDTKCSITTLGTRAYFEHPSFEAYMVAIDGPDFQYVGPPDLAPWHLMTGPGSHWISHNAAFDECLQLWLIEKGILPATALPDEWDCTADMVAYLGIPRSLKNAVKAVLGIDLSKDTRDDMKGKRWSEMTDEFQKEVVAYALNDGIYSKALWDKCQHLWPRHERLLSRQTRRLGWKGVPVDVEKLNADIQRLEHTQITALDSIPWAADGEKALSTIALAKACRALGIEPPASVAVEDARCEAWKKANDGSEAVKWITAIQDYRSGNALLKKLYAVRERTFNGRMDFNLKYAGAHTLRWSGGGGVNMQNLPRSEMFGVDLRSTFRAPEGKVFILCDLSQIEPRTLHVLAGDKAFIKHLRQNPDADLYDIQSRNWGMYSDPAPLRDGNPGVRQLVKSLNIGLGYMMGVDRFASESGFEQAEAEKWVRFYRRVNPLICALWEALDNAFRDSCFTGERTFNMCLPLRVMRYRRCSATGGLTCVMSKNGAYVRQRIWPGILVENLVQAFARDVFAWKLLLIEQAGYDICWHVHDEVIVEIDEADAEEACKHITAIMSADVSWCAEAGLDLPLGAEGKVSKVFKK
jgi:DNA polymerase family A